jgi:hypothetical protein
MVAQILGQQQLPHPRRRLTAEMNTKTTAGLMPSSAADRNLTRSWRKAN